MAFLYKVVLPVKVLQEYASLFYGDLQGAIKTVLQLPLENAFNY